MDYWMQLRPLVKRSRCDGMVDMVDSNSTAFGRVSSTLTIGTKRIGSPH